MCLKPLVNNIISYAIAVVEDDPHVLRAIANILRKCNCTVTEHRCVEDAIKGLCGHSYDAIFCDIRFKDTQSSGMDLLKHVVKHHENISLFMMSSAMDHNHKNELIQQGATDCLQKPFFREACMHALQQVNKNSHQ